MATIILDAGEEFEHFHSEASETILLEGKVEYIDDINRISLSKGVIKRVPGNVAHTLKNVGDARAMVACKHDLGH